MVNSAKRARLSISSPVRFADNCDAGMVLYRFYDVPNMFRYSGAKTATADKNDMRADVRFGQGWRPPKTQEFRPKFAGRGVFDSREVNADAKRHCGPVQNGADHGGNPLSKAA